MNLNIITFFNFISQSRIPRNLRFTFRRNLSRYLPPREARMGIIKSFVAE